MDKFPKKMKTVICGVLVQMRRKDGGVSIQASGGEQTIRNNVIALLGLGLQRNLNDINVVHDGDIISVKNSKDGNDELMQEVLFAAVSGTLMGITRDITGPNALSERLTELRREANERDGGARRGGI